MTIQIIPILKNHSQFHTDLDVAFIMYMTTYSVPKRN